MKGFFRGAATALVTPFSSKKGKREINFSVLKQLLFRQFACGIEAIVILGSTGESATVSPAERREIFEFCVSARNEYFTENNKKAPEKQRKKKTKLIFGCGANETRAAALSAEEAQKFGADGALAITPYYNKCSQKGLYLYYREICAATSLPVICYNAPSRTGVNILPSTMQKIADFQNVAGIKDAASDMKQTLQTLRLTSEKCDVYSGDDFLNLPILLCGGSGVISVSANVAPEIVQLLCNSVFSKNLPQAILADKSLAPLNEALFCEVNPIPLKYAMRILGFDCGAPRAPLTEIENRHKRKIDNAVFAVAKLSSFQSSQL